MADAHTSANPCLSCGACCACFRVSFYWGESDAAPGGYVPAALTQPISPYRAAMQGTDQPEPRCVALEGQVGSQVLCTIHPKRPSPCREFNASWEKNIFNEACDRARQKYHLAALEPGWDQM
ncbi:MAG: YkgJ family cysteine cluster protein [Thiothrix sp.]|nr:MAG: YkgJ family cysteine cluster protein [Thiothrix sp.]